MTIEDETIPANTGTFRLRVSGGEGALTRASGTGTAVTSRGLAALYSGLAVTTLRAAELVHGGDRADDNQLDAAFAGSTSYMLDFF